jgi:hypothetical protein
MAAELLGVLLAGVVSFFVVIGYAFGILFMWACGIVSGLFLMVALFSGVMWLFTHSPHAFHTMLGFLGYATVPFALIVAMTYYHGKLTDRLKARQDRRAPNGSGSSRPRERIPARPDLEPLALPTLLLPLRKPNGRSPGGARVS